MFTAWLDWVGAQYTVVAFSYYVLFHITFSLSTDCNRKLTENGRATTEKMRICCTLHTAHCTHIETEKLLNGCSLLTVITCVQSNYFVLLFSFQYNVQFNSIKMSDKRIILSDAFWYFSFKPFIFNKCSILGFCADCALLECLSHS